MVYITVSAAYMILVYLQMVNIDKNYEKNDILYLHVPLLFVKDTAC